MSDPPQGAGRPARETDARTSDDGRAAAGLIARAAIPLPHFDDPLFGAAFDSFAGARVVLLGEASHGTSEFYRARASITRWLIEQHGFNIVAVEADWPDAAVVDRAVRHRGRPAGQIRPFARFPTWMWRNREVEAFTQWLADHNRMRPMARRAGFYGLDLYSLSASMRAVIDYLDKADPEAAQVARTRYGCLTPWSHEPATYGRAALSRGYAPCEAGVVAMLREMLESELARQADGEDFLDAAMNAHLVQNAEAYYRAMYYGSAESWNLRDTHMFETLEGLLAHGGPDARAVVWAHNSHIGDARATGMAGRGELNIGQLCRQRHGKDAALIGFGTHTGTVACASDWDEPMEIKPVLPSRPDSYERLAHLAGRPQALIDLREGVDDALRAALAAPRLERFIGVIYRPETERWSHYVECRLAEQFDAYVWFDETRAVTPLPAGPIEVEPGAEETWPFGL